MSRESTDELADDGTILNGYDYNLQNWVKDGVLCDVGNATMFWGWKVKDVPGHEVRQSYPVCPYCQSPDIKFEATARWNNKKQAWGLSTMRDDQGTCDECYEEFSRCDWRDGPCPEPK